MERVGRYRILRRLSSGGIGVVYLGVAEGAGRFERLSAIKLLNSEHRDRPDCISMFLDEARIGARIQHPNLVSVQEIGEHEGELFIAMDYVHGENLSCILERHIQLGRSFPIPVVCEIGVAVAEAVHAMHRGDVIHGDVSPQNILIGYDGRVRLTDFGISQSADNMFQATSSTVRGKICYLAPELLLGGPQQVAGDIYSLGVVLWELCAGKRLFEADLPPAVGVARRLASADIIERPDQHRPDLPPELTAIALKALSAKPELRHPDARTLGSLLRAFQIEHCPSVSSQPMEEYMGELFADQIANRGFDSLRSDDTVSHAGDTLEDLSVAESAAPAPLVEPMTPPTIADITALGRASPSRSLWTAMIVSIGLTVALLCLAGIPVRDKPPEAAPKVTLLKRAAATKPRTKARPKRKRARPAPKKSARADHAASVTP